MNLENKILHLCDNTPKNVKERKIINLMKIILIDGETDLDKILVTTPISYHTLEKYIEDKEFFLMYLTLDEFDILKNKVDILKQSKKENIKNLEVSLFKNIIDDIFNTRHKVSDICSNNYIDRKKFNKLMADDEFIKQSIGFELRDKAILRIQETAKIRKSLPSNKVLIEDRYKIFIAKEGLYYIDYIDDKKLTYAAEYICSGANVEMIEKKFDVNISNILFSLSDLRLRDILKPNIYNSLVRCIEIEKCLMSSNIELKMQILTSVINILKQNDYDIDLASNIFGVPKYLFERLIKNVLALPYFDEDIENKIKSKGKAI